MNKPQAWRVGDERRRGGRETGFKTSAARVIKQLDLQLGSASHPCEAFSRNPPLFNAERQAAHTRAGERASHGPGAGSEAGGVPHGHPRGVRGRPETRTCTVAAHARACHRHAGGGSLAAGDGGRAGVAPHSWAATGLAPHSWMQVVAPSTPVEVTPHIQAAPKVTPHTWPASYSDAPHLDTPSPQ